MSAPSRWSGPPDPPPAASGPHVVFPLAAFQSEYGPGSWRDRLIHAADAIRQRVGADRFRLPKSYEDAVALAAELIPDPDPGQVIIHLNDETPGLFDTVRAYLDDAQERGLPLLVWVDRNDFTDPDHRPEVVTGALNLKVGAGSWSPPLGWGETR